MIELSQTDDGLSAAAAAVRAQMLAGDLCTVATLAEALGKKERTVASWMTKGMPHLKFGNTVYISVREAREWLISRKDTSD